MLVSNFYLFSLSTSLFTPQKKKLKEILIFDLY